MDIRVTYDDLELTSSEFIELFQSNWSRQLDPAMVNKALATTTNITARKDGKLVGCLRILTDGYLISFICDIAIEPQSRNTGIGSELLNVAMREFPLSLLFAVQNADDERMRNLGWAPGYPSYVFRK